MKKYLILLFGLMFFVITACGSNEETANSDESTNSSDSTSESAKSGNWEPEGNLEFIAPFGAGGGHDTLLRTMDKIMHDEGIIEERVMVENRPGGNSIVGMEYTKGKSGETNAIMSFSTANITAPLLTETSVAYSDFTPIALLGEDPFIIVATPESGVTNMEEFEENVSELTVGGAAIGGGDHMLVLTLQSEIGQEINYVPFENDGEQLSAILGNHVDVMATNIQAVLEMVEEGELVPLAVSSEERIEAINDIPTLKEQGYDISFSLFRGIVGPPDMPEEARDWFAGKFEELSNNEVWQADYLDKNFILNKYLAGEDFKNYLDETSEFFKANLQEIGLID